MLTEAKNLSAVTGADTCLPDTLAIQIARYQKLEAELTPQHSGRYIAVTDNDFSGPYDDESETLRRANQAFGDVPMLIHRLGDPFQVVNLS